MKLFRLPDRKTMANHIGIPYSDARGIDTIRVLDDTAHCAWSVV